MTIIKEFSWCKKYDIDSVKVDIHSNYITIYYSYKIRKKKHMKEVLNWIKGFKNLDLPMYLLVAEWKTHNLLYNWNYQRERTRHVNLENTMFLKHRIRYFLLSLFYWN